LIDYPAVATPSDVDVAGEGANKASSTMSRIGSLPPASILDLPPDSVSNSRYKNRFEEGVEK
jgi:hypothetical protein